GSLTQPAKKGTQRSAKSTTAIGKTFKGFTDEERIAMKERIQELKAAARRGPRADKADGETAVLAKIAEMPEPDRAMAKRLHAIIKASTPAHPAGWSVCRVMGVAAGEELPCCRTPSRQHRRRIMRYLAVLFSTIGLAACSTAPVTRSESHTVTPTQVLPAELQNTAIDSVVQFLLTAAATDFHTHRPPDPVRFRVVRIGHVMTPSGREQYMLCGDFMPTEERGKAEWTPF